MTLNPDLCIDTRAALPLYVGGDLDGDECLSVEGHLAECPACQAARHRAEEARSALIGHSVVGQTPDLWEPVRARLAGEGLLGPSAVPVPAPLSLVRGPRLLPVGLSSAAAAVLFAFLLSGLLRPGGEESGSGGLVAGPGFGGSIEEALPVVHQAPKPYSLGGLRRLPEGKEPLYLRAREMRSEQGVVAPLRGEGLSPASVLQRR